MDTAASIRRPGELRVLPGHPEQLPSFGHCLGCHRGVFLSEVVAVSNEPQGYCQRCRTTPAFDRRVESRFVHQLRRATDLIGRGTRTFES